MLKRSNQKLTEELDILEVIRSRRMIMAANFGLLKNRHKKFVEKMAITVLSEYSSSDTYELVPKNAKNGKLDFVNDMLESPSDSDLRYLNLYETLDSKRTASWLRSKPE
jgi:hypothetical protein